MFYLAHISDLHLSPLPTPSFKELCSKRITGYLNWKFKRQNIMAENVLGQLIQDLKLRHPHHLAITGDLVNLALEKEFLNAVSFLQKLGDLKKISLTFGNHDAYVRGAFKKACQHFAPWIESDLNLKASLIHNKNAFKTNCFPYLHIRENIAIIGVSSALAMPPFCAAGYVSKAQCKHLKILLETAKQKKLFRVVLIHHPPVFKATSKDKQLLNISAFQKILNGVGAELILHGHTHLPTLYSLEGYSDKPIPVVGVASAAQSFGTNHPAAGYNWFAIEKDGQNWRCTLSRYALANEKNQVRCFETLKLL